jgi:hypothetical protein
VVIQADVFEASHTYSLGGTGQYLTLIEAEGPGGTRYYKAYLADDLGGEWRSLADTWEHPFAGRTNVTEPQGRWTDSISHGELLRSGSDERLTVDPAELTLLFQGVTDEARSGLPYGQIPWRLGLLTQER